jgi:hypothetical protein
MRISVFAPRANPETDRRLYPLSESRAKALIVAGKAIELSERAIQLLPEPDRREDVSAIEDWHTVHTSLIAPGKFLRITTLQLA